MTGLHEPPGVDDRVVIVGGGQAGAECAATLRMNGHQGSVTVLAEENSYPYARPSLSKAYLSGSSNAEDLYIRPPATYEQQNIDLRLGIRVMEIDRQVRVVRLQSATDVPYDRLVLATGGRARLLPWPAAQVLSNVHTIRGLTDIDFMRDQFVEGARLVVIGGGYVGLEVAAVARRSGLTVTVLEAAPRVLARVAVPEMSAFFERVHTEEGVDVRTGCSIASVDFSLDGRASSVTISDGTRLAADLVVVGIGLTPNTELAEQCGLPVEDGIIVDEFCRTTDPRILAIGDCARHPCAQRGGSRRLESVPNAIEQARVAAGVLTGNPLPYEAIPWFWSDQYDVKMQAVGMTMDHDQIVLRGNVDSGRSFSLFHLRGGVLRAAVAINRPRDFIVAKKLIAANARVAAEHLRDDAVPLKQWLRVPEGGGVARSIDVVVNSADQ